MRTFTFSDVKSHKFWNIELTGKSFTVTYGRIGAAGQTQTKEFATEEKARAEHDKLIKEKLAKGYTETTPAAAAPAAAPAPKPAAPAPPPPAPAAGGVRKFTFSDATSHKFWNIELQAKSFTVTYGRQGTAGQTQTKTFPTEEKAKAEHDKLVKEKTAKGYIEEKSARSAAAPGAPLPSGSLREALEAAIIANPDDLMAHQGYADHLNELGDPRGEFIQVQLALEDASKPAAERKKLQKKEKDLLKKHGRTWLGELAKYLMDQEGIAEDERKYSGYKYVFRRGWLDTIEANRFGVNFTRCLAGATEQTRALRQLFLEEPRWMDDDQFEPGADIPEDTDHGALYPLARARSLASVRVFRLGEALETAEQAHYPNCHTSGEAVVGVVKQMPKLEELYLLAHNVDADQLFGLKTLNMLRVLMVYHNDSYPLAKLAKNPSLGNLTTLRCHPHAMEEEPYIRLAGLREIVKSSCLTSLTHLELRLSDFGDKGAEEIVKSGILKRLKVLDLRGGRISDKGAKVLAGSPDLKHLELLDVSRNCMTNKGQKGTEATSIQALEATGVKLIAESQWIPGAPQSDWDMPEYLFEGDIE